MRHGKDKFFSSKGIHLAINYWTKNGHQVVCFVPEYIVDYQQVADKKKMKDMGLKEVKASQIPDDVGLLNKLLAKDILVKTPAQDYDDSYCIQYAKKLNAFIVTNDKFRDYLDQVSQNLYGEKVEKKQKNQKQSKNNGNDKSELRKEQAWIKAHSVSYSFNKDEFLPNPDCRLWEKCKLDQYRNYTLDLI